jgi:uncharacterized protein YutE (UPF0331/DUF86 family)
MMRASDSSKKRERTRLLEVANEYKAKGYEVFIEPTKNQRPDFLGNFQPDLIAISTVDKVVVEVKSKTSLKESGNLEALARLVEKHKDWRLELVLTNPREQNTSTEEWSLLPIEDLQLRITQANDLLENLQQPDSAMLLLWVAAEATLQYIAKRESVNLTRQSPKLLIKELLSLGIINKQAYVTLTRAADFRNRIVHGYTSYSSVESVFKDTKKLITEMLTTLVANRDNQGSLL